MKIVLKTSSSSDKDLQKSNENKEKSKDNVPKKNNNSLTLAFGDKNDTFSDKNKEVDGKHLLSKNKFDSSKPTSELFKTKNLPSKKFDSLNESVPDPELDPQLYLYDEFLSDKNEQESKKLKYLGFVDESKKAVEEEYDDLKSSDNEVDKSDRDNNTVSNGRDNDGKDYKDKEDKEDNEEQDDKSNESKKSRYMSKMVSIASKRQMERDIAFEKQLLKEELKSDSNVGEVFITGAYKKKLEERKKFEEEQRKQDEYDAIHSKNSLTKLHTYLLNTGLAKRSTTNTSK